MSQDKSYIRRNDVKDTISVITLPKPLEAHEIEAITNYVMLLLAGQRKEINEWLKEKMIDYCYDFAWHYGRLYHIGDAEKIKAAINEKFILPEEFIGELLNSEQNPERSVATKMPNEQNDDKQKITYG